MLPKIETLQIVFVGQPGFEQKLRAQGLRQLEERVEIKHQIRSLSEDESKQYIDHRLRLAKSSSPQRFTPRAIDALFDALGNPASHQSRL